MINARFAAVSLFAIIEDQEEAGQAKHAVAMPRIMKQDLLLEIDQLFFPGFAVFFSMLSLDEGVFFVLKEKHQIGFQTKTVFVIFDLSA